ncbi:hypothetical protein HPB52_012741 [Rhipicephalus sanguineus]|uniref:Uncharacterized protein n=1 Tax=Rhipicephalus sanguineus TaxID=34632 RepID=A0A9D4SQR1_RHISA|nr:hypothetical protein HPB52_012741 [Rhipicephalus sanguineus]
MIVPSPKRPASGTPLDNTTQDAQHTHSMVHDPANHAPFAAADREFTKRFSDNPFGFACTVCERLWFTCDLRDAPARAMQYLRTMSNWTMATTVGKLPEFQQDDGNFEAYLERFEVFAAANDIVEDKKLHIFLTAIGEKAYVTLRS